VGFIKINNRKNFLIGEIPAIHPESLQYIKYWKSEKRRCIEGAWSIDDAAITVNLNDGDPTIEVAEGKWRWMPPNLYFYCNHGTIELNPEGDDETAPKIKSRPDLRDFEWEFMYNWMECRGFSGFEDDEEFSCDRRIPEYEEALAKFKKYNKDIYRKRARRIKRRIRAHCYIDNDKDGDLKTFIPAREYLRKLHKNPLGLALFSNEAKDLMLLGARGGGKSYLVGVGILLHEFLFDGMKRYIPGNKNIPRAQLCIGAALTSKSAEIIEKFVIGHENLQGEWAPGTLEHKPSPFIKKTSGSLEPNNIKNPYRWRYEAKKGNQVSMKGSGTSLKHICYKDNAEAAAGGRYSVQAIEEVGLMGNVLAVHGSNEATMMKDGTIKFGSSVYIGTGGNVDKIQEAEIMFRDPNGFSLLAFQDEWEGTGELGWFVPAYYMDGNYKDENGNTLMEEALDNYQERRIMKGQATDSSALAIELMNFPLVPSEMFLDALGSMFPQAEIKAHLAEVISDPRKYEDAHYFGDLVWQTDGTLKWEQSSSRDLVREFPVKNNKNKPGVIELFEQPKRDKAGTVYPNRYVQGTDTYDDDESSTNSLGSTFVLDVLTGRIVAEYTGRRGTKEFYEITRKLNSYYRTAHNYENNKKGLYSYYDNKHSTHLLCDTPKALKDVVDIRISKVGNAAKGTFSSEPVKSHGLRLILDWLLEPAYAEENEDILNLHKIRSIGLLRELLNYKPKGNFDRVSALIMVMIIKEDRTKFQFKRQEEKVKTLSNDPFFKKHYDRTAPRKRKSIYSQNNK